MIDFNDAVGGSPGTPYGPTLADDGITTVTFFAGTSPLALGPAYGAVPDTTDGATTAFGNDTDGNDSRDPISGGADSGFLTDEPTGPNAALDYYFTFSIGLTNLSLDIIDFRGDGFAPAPALATLETYASNNWTGVPIGVATFGPATPQADGWTFTLADLGGGPPILSARVTFNKPDVGTGIDNLRWDGVVPEPGTVILFGTGLLALGTIVRKRRAA
jgi:hypothetical protein